MERANWGKYERIVLGAGARHKVRFCRGVLRFWSVGKHDQEAVSSEQERNDEQEQQQQEAREAPHPVDAVVVLIVASGAQTNGEPGFLTRCVVVRVGAAGCFLRIGKAVVVVVRVLGQVAHVAFWESVGQVVAVRVVEHGQGQRKRFLVERVVGPHRQVHRLGGVHRGSPDAAVESSVSSWAPTKGQTFREVTSDFPRIDFTAAVDERQEGLHGLIHKEVHVLRWVLKREREVQTRVKRVADPIAVRVHRHAACIHGARRAARQLIGVGPSVVVVVEVLNERWVARGIHAKHQLIGFSVAVGIHSTRWIERERIGSGHAATVCRCFGTVADAVAVAVGIAWAGADGKAGFLNVGQAVAVHVVVHEVADAVAVHVVRTVVRIERVGCTVDFERVEETVVVVVVVRRQATRTVGVFVGVGITVGVDRQVGVERVAVRAGVAHAFHAQTTIAEAVAVRVWVARVGADDALVGVGHAVVVVVLVLDEGVGLNARIRVVIGQLVGHAVAVVVLQDFEPEGGLNRERRVGRVRPNRVGRVLHRLGWRAGDDTGRRVKDQAVGQVSRREFPGCARNGIWRVDRGRLGVVHEHGWSKWPGAYRVGIRTGQTDWRNGVGSVADAVAVGVRIQGIRTEVAGAVVDACACLRQVRSTVAVVVQVFHQFAIAGVVFGQFVGQTVSVGVFQNLQVEIKGDGRGIGDARNGVRDVRRHFDWCTADDTTDRVNVQSIRQVWRDTPCRTRQLIRRHEAAEQSVVQAVNDAFCCFSKRCGVRTGHADEAALSVIDGVRSVANTVVIGVRVKWVGAGVGWSVVDARVRLVHVVQAVTVVVLVLRQRWDARGVAVNGVGLAVAVRVGIGRRVKREGIRAGGTYAAHGVGAVTHAVAVRIGVGWTGARVRFVGVGHAVSVVVKVLGEPGRIGVGWVVIAR